MTCCSTLLTRLSALVRSQAVLCAAWLLAIVSAFFVPPDGAYWGYLDLKTLCQLFSLMTVMAGLRRLGVFSALGARLLTAAHTTRQLEAVLVFLCFFSSMLITNDVALITFVPFTFAVLQMAGQSDRIPFVVILQTIAANLGSVLLPIGNPQNLYLYAHAGYTTGAFVRIMLPYTAISFVLLALLLVRRKAVPIPPPTPVDAAPPSRGKLTLYLGLFVLCLLTVARLVPYPVTVAAAAILTLLFDRQTLRAVDYSLLLTFIGFFVFVGNLQRIPLLHDAIAALLKGHEVLTAVLASQVISNVPAALLLTGFTDQYDALLIGVNVGGLGTLIASMASLISYRLLCQHDPALRQGYVRRFTFWNLLFLVILLVFAAVTHGL
jgi:Na+/H+ antiporter NhaD/arsenite permease-like protein